MNKSTGHWYERFDADVPSIEAPPRESSAGERASRGAAPASGGGLGVRAVAAAVATAASAAALIFLGLPAGQHARHVLLAHFEHDFTAPPYFSLAAFRDLKPGMGEDEVRDRIGYPWERRGNRARGVQWIYTAPVPGDSAYRKCTAVFDPRSGCLRLVQEVEAPATRAPATFGGILESGPVRAIRFGSAGVEQEIVRSTDPPCLILTGEQTAEAARRNVESVTDWIRLLGLRPCTVRYVYIGADAEGFPRAPEAAEEGLFTRSLPALPADEAGSIYLYTHGRIVTLPPYRDPEHGSERLADQEWVLRRHLEPRVLPNT